MTSLVFQRLRGVFLGGLLACWLAGCGDHQAAALQKLAAKGYSLSVDEFVRAAKAGDAQAVRWFVEAGVEPSLPDTQHHTALGEAVDAGKLPAVEALVGLGVPLPHEGEPAADLLRKAVKARSLEVLHFLIEHQVTGKGLPSGAVSPLAAAASLGQREAAELLLPLSAGREQEALFAGAAGGDVAVLSLLIRAGASVLERQAESGKTALMLAAEAGHAEAVELLFNAGSNRWALDREGKPALNLAQAAGNQKAVALLTTEPTTEEREMGAIRVARKASQEGAEERRVKSLDGASLAANTTWAGALNSLLVLRECREEMVPFLFEGVVEGRATFRLLPSGRVQPVEPKDEVGGSGWYLSHIEPSEGQPPVWWLPQVTIRNSRSGRRLVMVPGVPGRCGGVVAVLEFGPAKDVYETMPGDKFTLTGTASRTYEVDSVNPQGVQLHSLDTPGDKINLTAGALR